MTKFSARDPNYPMTRYLLSLSDDMRRTIMSQHLQVLRQYAQRLLLDGGHLTVEEQADKDIRMGEFMAIGSAFEMSKMEMVTLVYRGLFEPQDPCPCPKCRT